MLWTGLLTVLCHAKLGQKCSPSQLSYIIKVMLIRSNHLLNHLISTSFYSQIDEPISKRTYLSLVRQEYTTCANSLQQADFSQCLFLAF